MESEKTSLLFKSEVETFQPSRRGSVSPPDRPRSRRPAKYKRHSTSPPLATFRRAWRLGERTGSGLGKHNGKTLEFHMFHAKGFARSAVEVIRSGLGFE